jgi:6-pyruvoyltetrahydropterin/6-carboxytetrahydropterin synthase
MIAPPISAALSTTALRMTVATGSFESARHVDLLPEGHPCRSLHGHSFKASAFAQLESDWAPYPGGEVPALRQRMTEALEPLNYVHLNTVIDQPTDENIARWIRTRLDMPQIGRIAVQSTAHQGVDLDRAGHFEIAAHPVGADQPQRRGHCLKQARRDLRRSPMLRPGNSPR